VLQLIGALVVSVLVVAGIVYLRQKLKWKKDETE
jgi:hypothetical protein